MTNSHKNVIDPFLESSTLLIMTFPEIVESKDRLWGRTCAVDNVRARRKGVRGKLYEIQISPERGLRNSLNFPSYFGMEYARPWNMGKKLLEIRRWLIWLGWWTCLWRFSWCIPMDWLNSMEPKFYFMAVHQNVQNLNGLIFCWFCLHFVVSVPGLMT